MLLCLERADRTGQFRRHIHVIDEQEPVSGQLCAIRKIEVFGKGIKLPSTGNVDSLAPPDAGRAVEVHRQVTPRTRHLFDIEMSIEKQRLSTTQQ